VFNSLSSINYFIAKEDRLAANEYIADFSRLIRSIIDNLGEDYVTLDKELRSLNDYLKLEHLRFGDRFTYTLSAEKKESPDDVTIFPGMIQPFVENAIWHGVRNLAERKGHIRIVLDSAGPELLRCTIEDDGIGRKKAMAIRGKLSGHRSRGIELVSERLKIYNAMTRRDYKIIIEDLYPEREDTGTRVTVDIPAGRINLR
jgi:LytS/YehU family sensor histidine kinase